MFSRISRYRDLPDEATPDARGRVVRWRSLRLAPPAPGTFLHTVEDGDRLDHLAFKYYQQPRDWWRIADANPGILSPTALLGHEPRPTVRIPVEWEGPVPPWAALLRTLRTLNGVERAVAGTPEAPHPTVAVAAGELLATLDPALAGALDESGRAQALTSELRAALLDEGLDLAEALRIEKPDPATWVLWETPPARVFVAAVSTDPAELAVFSGRALHAWTVEATYDATVLAAAALLARVEAAGFGAGPAVEVGRVGKPLIIPPRRA